MDFIKSDYFIIIMIVAFVVVTFLFVNSKIGYVSIKKKKIRMELEHLKSIYQITSEELEKLLENEEENKHLILSQSLYINIITGKLAGYCYLLDYICEYSSGYVVIRDKKKNDIFKK